VNLLLAVGRLLGTAVEGARLFDALQWQNRLTRASNRELQRSRRQLEESLTRMEEANRALEQLDRMKSSFLALASHELRTPLTYVLSGAELLSATLAERLSPEERQTLNAVRQGGERLENIVQDLLEAARIESRSLYLACETVDLAAIVAEVGEEFRPVFEKRRLSCQMAGFASPIELCGDGHHLKRTFRRLLENAVKFTPEGGCIQIRAALTTPAELRPHEAAMRAFSPGFWQNLGAEQLLQVTVQDNGVGIDPEEQLRVFDKFYEVGDIAGHFTSRTRFGGKGVGLGLTLVKGMVEAHGGMVWVESRGTGGEALGSSFHVLLPLTPRGMEASDAAG
jgi:signal transduction histidine kinase